MQRRQFLRSGRRSHRLCRCSGRSEGDRRIRSRPIPSCAIGWMRRASPTTICASCSRSGCTGCGWNSAKATSRLDTLRAAAAALRALRDADLLRRPLFVSVEEGAVGPAGARSGYRDVPQFLRDLGKLGDPDRVLRLPSGEHLHDGDGPAPRLHRARVRPERFPRQGGEAAVRAGVLRRRDLGELHVLRESRAAGRRGGGRETGAASRRSAAGEDERRRQAVHALRRLPPGRADRRRQSELGPDVLRGHLVGGRRRRWARMSSR